MIDLGNGLTAIHLSEKAIARRNIKIPASELSSLEFEEEYLMNTLSDYWVTIKGKKKQTFQIPDSSYPFENDLLNNHRNIDLLIRNDFFGLGRN